MDKETTRRQDELTSLKEAEFKHGDRPDGTAIGKYRSKSYAAFKQRKNPLAGGDVDLILTGDLINSAFLKKNGEGSYLFGFRDGKAPDLLKKYNRNAKGQQNLESLNQDTFTDWQIEKIKPVLVETIKKELGQ